MPYDNELQAYAGLLGSHLRQMIARLRMMPAEKWDWSPSPSSPTARILATQTWQWLVCDRQHLTESDVLRHSILPDPPTDMSKLCDLLAMETETWESLILSLTAERLQMERLQFNRWERNGRNFVCHIIQQCIYKNGQLATLFFALGLDGVGSYSVADPNTHYRQMQEDEVIRKLIGQ